MFGKVTYNLELFQEIRRLLLFAGSKVFDSHFTADGITSLIEHKGRRFRIFVTEVEPMDRIMDTEETTEQRFY
jgi:hypothetical protein